MTFDELCAKCRETTDRMMSAEKEVTRLTAELAGAYSELRMASGVAARWDAYYTTIMNGGTVAGIEGPGGAGR